MPPVIKGIFFEVAMMKPGDSHFYPIRFESYKLAKITYDEFKDCPRKELRQVIILEEEQNP